MSISSSTCSSSSSSSRSSSSSSNSRDIEFISNVDLQSRTIPVAREIARHSHMFFPG